METVAHSPPDKQQRNLQILKRRAADLAMPIKQEESSQIAMELLVFTLGTEQYALETRFVKEVYPLKEYTPLPCTPPFIFGLINLRRKILTVADIRSFFSIPYDPSGNKKMIVIEDRHHEFAILCDGIIGIQKMPYENLQATLPTLTGIRQDFLRGVATDGTVVLDGEKLLSSKHLIVDETVDIL